MENPEAAFEAEVELDGEAIRQRDARQRPDRAEKAAALAKGGIEISPSPPGSPRAGAVEQEDGETSPLLPRRDEDERRASYPEPDDFSKLPWHKRPSIFWVLGPFFLMACAFGGVITPKINLILELICKQYMSEQLLLDPNFTMVPVDFNNGDNDQCRIPVVQSRVAQFTLWGSLIAGLLSAITSPKLGALSDRYGRKRILVFTSVGTILSEIITICAATYPETFPVDLLLLGFAVDGLTGSFIVAMAISNSYATDCTPPAQRNVAFGFFHGCLFTGIAVGPIIAGYVIEATGKIVTVFYILLAVHVFFVTFISIFVPESLTKKRQMLAREKYKRHYEHTGAVSDWYTSLNLLQPLKVLWPTGAGTSSALRRNLFFLAAVDTIVFGVAMGSLTVIVIYTNYMFGWKSFESGRFLSIVNASRVFGLVVLMPILTRLVRGKPDERNRHKNTGCDSFDLSIIRVSVFFDTLGYLGYTLARTGPMMILSGVVAALGGMGAPTLQSALTKHVPADQTGQLLGASGLLHALARVVAPTVFNAIYAATVGKFTQTVFVCLAATFGTAFLITWALRTNSE
jgi:MFS family permease